MKTSFIAALIAAAVAFPVAAQAQSTYVGINAGQSEQKVSADNYSAKESATGYKAYAGYNFDKNFGLEAGFVDSGKGDFKFVGVPYTLKTQSVYLAATATLPVNNEFSLFAKAGIANNRVKGAVSFGGITEKDDTDDRTTAMFGLGASYAVAQNISIVAEYENFGKVAKGDNSSVKTDLVSLGLRFKF
jgi:OOP family OmpA-OmpF porin